ncbi:MAG: signal peptidase I [Bacteroidales bacterium]|jgi:signal peptidase I|nr:signal peptidase I [Bacteroidales bacterium]
MRVDLKNPIQWIICLIVMVLIVVNALIFFNPMHVSGDSMLPTYKNRSIIFVNTANKNIEVGDIVVFYYGDLKLVKRIFGMQGDNIRIEDFSIYKNDVLIYTVSIEAENDISLTLGENEYFVLGDNLDNSNDSRFFGSINIKNIIGKVWV